nr:methylmalonyl-CoA mutase family protein [Streptomyces alkaliphilus]
MTINAPAAVLLLLYQLVAEEQGVSADKLTGTIQNDVLKEYRACTPAGRGRCASTPVSARRWSPTPGTSS